MVKHKQYSAADILITGTLHLEAIRLLGGLRAMPLQCKGHIFILPRRDYIKFE